MDGANFAMNVSRLSLSAVRIWPNLHRSRYFAVISNLTFVVSLILITYFIVIAQTTKLFLVGKDLDTIVEILCTGDIPVFVTIIKMLILRSESEVLKSLLYKIIDDWSSPHTDSQLSTMYENAKIGRRIAITCVSLAYSSSNLFLIIWFISLRPKLGRNFLIQSHFNAAVYDSPWFEIIWVMQSLGVTAATMAYSSIDAFFAVLVLHLCGQLVLLRDDLKDLVKNKDENNVQSDIARIVKRHNELNSFAQMIENTFNLMFIAQMLGCAVQFCLQGYQFISIVTDTSVELPILQLVFIMTYIIYIMVDLYIYCYFAEKLRGKDIFFQSLELSQAAYNCKWYNLKGKHVPDLMLVMKRAQHPLEITAGKFCALSLNLFTAIGKTSLGYLSMLLAVKERTYTLV